MWRLGRCPCGVVTTGPAGGVSGRVGLAGSSGWVSVWRMIDSSVPGAVVLVGWVAWARRISSTQCEGSQGGPGWDGRFAEALLVPAVLVEQLVGGGLDGVFDGECGVAGELAVQEGEPAGGGEGEPVAQHVVGGVVGAVGVEVVGEVEDLLAPLLEPAAARAFEEGGGEGLECCRVAVIDGAGEHAGVFEADLATGQGGVDMGEVAAQRRDDREPVAGNPGGDSGVACEPLRGRQRRRVQGAAPLVELGQ